MTPTSSHAPSRATRSPLFFAAVASAAGVATVSYFAPGFGWLLLILPAAIMAACVLRSRWWRSVALVFCLFISGMTRAALPEKVSAVENLGQLIDSGQLPANVAPGFEGVTSGVSEQAPGGTFFEVELNRLSLAGESREVRGRMRVFVASDVTYYRRTRLRFYCYPRRADEFRNPGVTPRREILDRAALDATCSVKSVLLIEQLGREPGFWPDTFDPGVVRATLIRRFSAMFDQPTTGVMIASLLGSKRFLDGQTAAIFREGGVFHVLVISGLHVSLIGALILLLLQLLTRRRIIHFVAVSLCLWFFSIGVGGEIPVVRAALMFTIMLLGRTIFRQASSLNSLGLAALISLVWRPEDIHSQSFWLTFASVGALVAGAFRLLARLRAIGEWRPTPATPFPPRTNRALLIFCETLYWDEQLWTAEAARNPWTATIRKRPWPLSPKLRFIIRWAFEGILVSSIVQLAMLPFSVVYFNRIQTGAAILNLWVGILLAAESVAAVAAMVASAVSDRLALPLVRLTELLNAVLIAGAEAFNETGLAGFRTPAYVGPAVGLYFIYAALVVALFWHLGRAVEFELRPPIRRRGLKLVSVVWCGTLLILLFHPFSAVNHDHGRLRIDFIDVGQGDAAIVTFPDGQTMLIDGGGRPQFGRDTDDGGVFEPDAPRIGEAVVSRFLWSRGLARIDFLVATHADADHIEGLGDVALNFDVGLAIVGREARGDADYDRFDSILRKRGVPQREFSRGEIFEIGGATVEVLWPEATDAGPQQQTNDQSVVLRISYGTRRFLFTGDIEQRGEEGLLRQPGTVRADIVKVPHHGSRTSSSPAFVAATKSTFAIIPVGRTSPFGHPHEEIVNRWQEHGVRTMTTGDHGTISVTTDGKDLIVGSLFPD